MICRAVVPSAAIGMGIVASALALALMPDCATAQESGRRKLAPGVLTVIPIAPEEQESFTGPRPLVDLLTESPPLDWTPNYAPKDRTLLPQTRQMILRHDVWTLEFAFKPLRMIEVDVPQATGKMQRKRLWYMVYRVKNNGGHLRPVAQKDTFDHETYTTEKVDFPVRFYPHFVLECQVLIDGTYERKAYLDRLLPIAGEAIREREDPSIQFLNSVEMMQTEVPVSDARTDRSVWGYVLWEEIDPRTDYLSIYVQGLTNAFRFEDLGDGTRRYTYKTLQLNFWRPGDSVYEHEKEIRYGVPIVTNQVEQARILRQFQVEGPQLVAYDISGPEPVELFHASAVDSSLDAPDIEEMDSGRLPDSLKGHFANAGITLPANVFVTPTVKGGEWEFTGDVGGEQHTFRIRSEAPYWDVVGRQIVFTNPLDYLWIYR